MESGETLPTLPEAAATVADLDRIETDLADVEVALARLEAGTYWTCEVTGQTLDDDVLAANPTARRSTAN